MKVQKVNLSPVECKKAVLYRVEQEKNEPNFYIRIEGFNEEIIVYERIETRFGWRFCAPNSGTGFLEYPILADQERLAVYFDTFEGGVFDATYAEIENLT